MIKSHAAKSIQLKMGRGFILLVFLTTQTLGVAQGQTTPDPNTSNAVAGVASAVGGIAANFGQTLPAVYQQTPQQLILSQIQTTLQSKLTACQAKATAGTATGKLAKSAAETAWQELLNKNRTKKTATTATTVDTTCDLTKAFSKETTCAMACDSPSEPTEVACEDYFDVKHPKGGAYARKSYTRKTLPADQTLEAVQKKFGLLSALNSWKSQNCSAAGAVDLKAATDSMKCMSDAMREAMLSAETQMQQVLNNNQAQYGKMVQYQNEVQDQIDQVEKILGPDPKLGQSGATQFKGLLALQAEMNESLIKAKDGETAFEGDLGQIDKDEAANNTTLEGERLQVVQSCLKGDSTIASGDKVQMCPKPLTRKSPDGKSDVPVLGRGGVQQYGLVACGTLDYIRAKIDEQTKNDHGHNMDRDGDRIQAGIDYSASFEGVVDGIMRQMGAYDAPTPEGRTDAQAHTWEDIQQNKQLMNKLNALDSNPLLAGVHIVQRLQNATKKCMGDADQWRVKQMKPGASRYSKEKLRVDNARKKLNGALDNGLSSLNKSYADVMAMLSDQHVALDRYSCQKDSAKMLDCYKNIRQNLADLLEGNGRAGFASKLIKGGTMVGGFTVPCRGINGCVTALRSVRDRQIDHVSLAQKSKDSFSSTANTQTDQQLAGLKQILGVGNKAIMDQFSAVKGMLANMGVDEIPSGLNLVEADVLQRNPAPNGEKKEAGGPYGMPTPPKTLRNVLAGGMLNPDDTGVDKMSALANKVSKEKKEAWSKKATEFKDAANKYAKAKSTCVSDATDEGGGDDGVTTQTSNCNNVAQTLYGYLEDDANKPLAGAAEKNLSAYSLIFKALAASGKVTDASLWDKLSEGHKKDIRALAENECSNQVKTLKVATDGSGFSTDKVAQ